MAHDPHLVTRIRELLAPEVAAVVEERRMFGGLAFLVAGHLAVAASGQGGLLVRVSAEEWERLPRSTAAVPMEMRGRPVKGWLRVDADHVRTRRQLAPWVARGVTCASSLPPK